MKRLCILMCILMASCRPAQRLPPGGEIARAVSLAKANSKTEGVVRVLIERSAHGELVDVLKASSVVLVRPIGSSVEVTKDHVVTWQMFKLIRWLLQNDVDPECGGTKKTNNEDGTLVAGFYKGSTIVDGITVRDTTMEHVVFDQPQYLLIANRCALGVIDIPRIEDGIFEVSEDGMIRLPPYSSGSATYVKAILELATVSSLEKQIASDVSPENDDSQN